MAHTRDRKMQEIYVDRDLSRWGSASVQRRINSLAGNLMMSDPATVADATTGAPSLATNLPGAWTLTTLPVCEGWYSAQGVPIGSVYYAWKKNSLVNNADSNWRWNVELSTDDIGTSSDTTAELRAAGPGTGTLTATATNRDYAAVQFFYATGPITTTNADYTIYWTCLAVYGNHGLTKQGTADATNAQGFYASDIIANVIARFCPLLNPSAIQATTYVIPQATYLDPIDPFDVIADVNKYHRWQFGVWENRTFTYGPTDLSDYDWSVDTFEPGVTLDVQGDSTDDGAFNGICVNFTDLQTGKENRLTPDTNPELADTDPENPANRAGIDRWDELSLSSPTTSSGAVQIASAALLEKNTPKGQGSITVRGHLKDRAGHWQQAWKVRAGDRVAITSSASLSDRPRLISETGWDNDTKTLTITVEDTAQRVDAVLDRLSTALTAAGLS
jgi:hypothetical protein